MKTLSDYKGEEAIELWGDLLEPAVTLLADPAVREAFAGKKSIPALAAAILKARPAEIAAILTRIDSTPIDGYNVLPRVMALINDVATDPSAASFFGAAEQAKEASVSSGSATGNTVVDEK